MMVKAESAGMTETAAAAAPVESVRREKKARRSPDDGAEFCGVRRRRSGKYGAQISCTASLVASPATAVGVPGMVRPSTLRALAEPPPPPHVGAPAGMAMATPVVGGSPSFSKFSTEDESTDDMGERGETRRASGGGADAGAASRKMMRFLEGLMKEAMERQEAMQQRFLEAIEKREQDRMVREQAWRRREMARLAREQEVLAQERAVAAARNAAVLSFIQKFTGQPIPMPSIAAQPIRSMPPPAPQPPSSQPPPASTQRQPSPRPQKPSTMPPAAPRQGLVVHQSTAETSHDASGSGGASLWRWSKAEVHALCQLRSNLGMRRKGSLLWEEISAGMRRMGYSRSSKQCMQKWGNMNYYFKKMKDSNKKCSDDTETCHYFHQLEELHRKKAALGSPPGAGAGGAAALPRPATEHVNAAPLDRIEAFAVAAPISRALHPHTLPAVARKDGNMHGVGGVSGGTQMQASNRFFFRDQSSMDLRNDLPKLPVHRSAISAGAGVEEFLKAFTDVVA